MRRSGETATPARLAIASAALSLALVLAACGAEPAAPGSECPAEAPASLPPQPWNDDPELAARIPDEVAGRPLEIQTVCATTAAAGGLMTSAEFLAAVGVELRDVTIARDRGPQAGAADRYTGITAWRYAGAEEERLRDALLDTFAAVGIEVEGDSAGGKPVHRALFHVYYVADDTLYSVLADDAQIDAVLEALP